MLVDLDQINFFDKIVVTQPIKEILDPALHRLPEYVIKIDINGFTIPKKNDNVSKIIKE